MAFIITIVVIVAIIAIARTGPKDSTLSPRTFGSEPGTPSEATTEADERPQCAFCGDRVDYVNTMGYCPQCDILGFDQRLYGDDVPQLYHSDSSS